MNKQHIIGTITIVGIIGITVYAIKKSRDVKKAEEESFGIDAAYDHVANYAHKDADFTKKVYDESHTEGSNINDIKDDAHDEANYNQSYGVDYSGNATTSVKTNMGEEIHADLPIHEEDMKKDVFEDDKPLEDGDIKGESRIEATLMTYGAQAQTYEEPEEEEIEDIDPSDQVFVSYKEPQINPEEIEELRHDPNSPEALDQFIRMELAEWREDHPTFQTMANLFLIDFVPRTDGDHILKTKIIDYRIGFFTHRSIHTTEITMADVILHYARASQYNIGETVGYWVEHFLSFNELYHEQDELELADTILELNSHAYFNSRLGTHGLFGLTQASFEQAEYIASLSFGGQVTYEGEFNEFLKACL